MSKQRSISIKVNYHYVVKGNRKGLQKNLAEAVVRAVIRRLERSRLVVVDDVEIKEA